MRVHASTTSARAYADGTEAFLKRVITAGVDDTRLGMQTDLRDQIVTSGLPRKIANIVRSRRYPQKGEALDAAGVVFERRNKPGGDTANLVSVFDEGPTIYTRNRRWLAIPAPTVQQGKYAEFGGRRHRVTPLAFEKSTGLVLRFVLVSSRLAFLVADSVRLTPKGYARKAKGDWWRSGKSVVCFILLPSVRLRKRLDWRSAALAAHAALPGNIARHWK